MRARHTRLPGTGLGILSPALVIAALLALLVLSSALRGPNLLAYDVAVQATVPGAHTSHVVLVESPGTLFHDPASTLPALVAALKAGGASHVVLLPPESGVHPGVAARMAAIGAVSWGRPTHLARGETLSGRLQLAPLGVPDSGVILPPATGLGTARGLPLQAVTTEGPRANVITSVAMTLGHETTGDVLWLNFNNGREQLPRVSATQVLQGTLAHGVIAGRVAVIGLPLEEHATGVTTPRVASTGLLSPSEFQALALDTALDEAGIRFLQGWGAVLLVLAVFFLHAVLFQLASGTAGAAFGIATMVISGIVTILSLSFANTFLPFAEMALAILSAHALVQVYRGWREDHDIADLHAKLRNKISARRFVTGFHDSAEPWQQLIALVNQHLTLTRSIFLETIPGDHRVREIASLNCSIQDIGERRRDFQRTPYSAALREELPLELSKPYLVTRNPAEREYMVALTFGGEVLGFWAFTVIPGAHWNRDQFLRNTRSFAGQIAELLWQRREWQDRLARKDQLPQRILTADIRKLGFREFRQSLAMIENRLDTLEDIFNGMSTAAVLYDLFGQVVQSNARMESMAHVAGLHLYDMPAVQLLCAATGCTEDDARARLRHVVVQQQTVELAARLPGGDSALLLRMRTLAHDAADARIHERPRQPFELLGILVELVDVTAASESLAVARDITEDVLHQVAQAVEDGAPAERVTALLHASLALAGRSMQPARDPSLPLDAARILRRVLERANPRLATARVTTRLSLPPALPLAFCDSVLLEHAFEDALDLLLADAPANTNIATAAVVDDAILDITLAGNGFGIPQDKVDAVFRDQATPSMGSALGRLRSACDRLREQGGDLAVVSAPGEGFLVRIRLRTFRLDTPAR